MTDYITFVRSGQEPARIYFPENTEDYVHTRLVQEAILRRFRPSIRSMVVYGDEKARREYEKDLEGLAASPDGKTTPDIQVVWKDLPSSSLKEWLSSLPDTDGSNLILDISNYEDLQPFSLYTTLSSLDRNLQARLEHIFYARTIRDREGNDVERIIEDFSREYSLHQAFNHLNQFSSTLTIHEEDWKHNRAMDDLLKEFFQAASSFNEVLEFCQFEPAIETTRKLVNIASQILEKPDDYAFLVPLCQEIIEKLTPAEKDRNIRTDRIHLIVLLLRHHRYQVAITFLDQFIREELVRAILLPGSQESVEKWVRENIRDRDQEAFVYDYSQLILNYFVHNPGMNRDSFETMSRKRFGRLPLHVNNRRHLESRLQEGREAVQSFYHDIRNHINHGQSISPDQDIEQTMENVLHLIQEL